MSLRNALIPATALVLVAFSSVIHAQAPEAAPAPAPAIDAETQRLMSNFGWFLSQATTNLKLNEAERKAILSGFESGLAGKNLSENPQKANTEVRRYITERISKLMTEENDRFFADLEKDPEIKKTPAGLYYKIIKEGEAERATRADEVKVHYTGSLIDGVVFDSSPEAEPVTFGVDKVVPGFGEGVRLIGKGGEIELYIKPELGYGRRGAPPRIPANAALVFKVQMVDIIRASK